MFHRALFRIHESYKKKKKKKVSLTLHFSWVPKFFHASIEKATIKQINVWKWAAKSIYLYRGQDWHYRCSRTKNPEDIYSNLASFINSHALGHTYPWNLQHRPCSEIDRWSSGWLPFPMQLPLLTFFFFFLNFIQTFERAASTTYMFSKTFILFVAHGAGNNFVRLVPSRRLLCSFINICMCFSVN